MAFVPVANIAQKQVNKMARPRQEIDAIVASTPEMVDEIAVRSGALPGTGAFKTNLYTGAGTAAADKAYMQALTRALPQYVNTYRAYQEELKKKNKDGTGDGMAPGPMPGYNPIGLLPSAAEYLPSVPQPARAKTAALYQKLSNALLAQSKRTKP